MRRLSVRTATLVGLVLAALGTGLIGGLAARYDEPQDDPLWFVAGTMATCLVMLAAMLWLTRRSGSIYPDDDPDDDPEDDPMTDYGYP